MANETDAEVRGKQDRQPRSKRVVERYDFDKGTWHRVEMDLDDAIFEMSEEVRNAYLDIITTISDMMSDQTMIKENN